LSECWRAKVVRGASSQQQQERLERATGAVGEASARARANANARCARAFGPLWTGGVALLESVSCGKGCGGGKKGRFGSGIEIFAFAVRDHDAMRGRGSRVDDAPFTEPWCERDLVRARLGERMA
jgi:hypothetical protein